MMNQKIIQDRFRKAAQTYNQNAVVQKQISAKMLDLLKEYTDSSFKRIYEFGCGTGLYSRLLKDEFAPNQFILNDLCSEMGEECEDILDKTTIFRQGDAETTMLPSEVDLITSCSTLQWFCSPVQFLLNCRHALSRNGILAFSTFGDNNIREVAKLTGAGLHYISKSDFEESLRVNYEILYSEEEELSLTFQHPLDVLYHLKNTGVNGTAKHRFTRSTLKKFVGEYEQFANDDGLYTLCYHPIYMILKKKSREVYPECKS